MSDLTDGMKKIVSGELSPVTVRGVELVDTPSCGPDA